MFEASIQQKPVPEELIGSLREFAGQIDDGDALRSRLDDDGYVLLRRALNRDDVLAARSEIFGQLHDVDEVEAPAIDGIATGRSSRRDTTGDLGRFWKSVSEGSALRHVSHGAAVNSILSTILSEPARAHDMMYLRPAAVGRSTRLHYDFPFFAGRSQRIFTAWIPLGDIPISDGPLTVIEGSNRFDDMIDPIRSVDYAADRSNEVVQSAAYSRQNQLHAIDVVRERGTRFLTTEFRAGDLIVFSGFAMHGSLDNHSPLGRVRLSVDVRYQPAADPADDERYFGPNPIGSNGGGYGDMKGAKPITEAW